MKSTQVVINIKMTQVVINIKMTQVVINIKITQVVINIKMTQVVINIKLTQVVINIKMTQVVIKIKMTYKVDINIKMWWVIILKMFFVFINTIKHVLMVIETIFLWLSMSLTKNVQDCHLHRNMPAAIPGL